MCKKMMKQNMKKILLAICVIPLFYECYEDETSVSYIQDEVIAKELVEAVRKSLDALDGRISTPFNATSTNPTNFGNILVSGEKTEDIDDGGGSGNNLETKITKIGIRFDRFSNNNLTITSSTGEYHYTYLRRWKGIGDNTFMITVRYKLNSCGFEFRRTEKELYRGTVTINYETQGNLATQYEATVTFAGGQSFKITGE